MFNYSSVALVLLLLIFPLHLPGQDVDYFEEDLQWCPAGLYKMVNYYSHETRRDSEFFEAFGDLYPRKPVAYNLQEAFGPEHAGSVQRFLSCDYSRDATLHGENTTLPDGSVQMGKHFKLERFWIYTLTDAPSVIDQRVSGEHWQITDTALAGYPVYSAGRVRTGGADRQNVYALSPDPGRILIATSTEMLKAMLAAHRGDKESILDMAVYADLKDVLEPGGQCVIQTVGAQQLLVVEQKVRSGEISEEVAEKYHQAMDRNPLYIVHSQQFTSEGVVTRRIMIFRSEEAAEKFSKIQNRTVTDPDAPEVYKKQMAMLNERQTQTVDGNKLIVTVISDREFMEYEKKHEKEISAWMSKRQKEYQQERKERMRQAEEARKEQEKQQP